MPPAPRIPPKPSRGPRREGALLLALSAAERAELDAAAAREAMPVTVWARSRLLVAARAGRGGASGRRG